MIEHNNVFEENELFLREREREVALFSIFTNF